MPSIFDTLQIATRNIAHDKIPDFLKYLNIATSEIYRALYYSDLEIGDL